MCAPDVIQLQGDGILLHTISADPKMVSLLRSKKKEKKIPPPQTLLSQNFAMQCR